MSQSIPLWRLREKRNLADTIAFRAAHCPVPAETMALEKTLLKPDAHIHLVVDANRPAGSAGYYLQKATRTGAAAIRVTVHFTANLGTMAGWRQAARAVLEQLASVAFFSEASRHTYLVEPELEQPMIDAFVERVMQRTDRQFAAARPRFTLARLNEIVEEGEEFTELRKQEISSHFQRLLAPYLGADGW